MKFNALLLSLGLFAANTLAASVTITMAGGSTKDINVQTNGYCVDLVQGTHHARLNGGRKGTKCTFYPDSGCSGTEFDPPVGTITTKHRETDMKKPANGVRCRRNDTTNSSRE